MINSSEYSKKQLVFVFVNEDEKISYKNDNLIVKDKDGHIKHQSTCWRVAALFIVGQLTITSGLIERSHKFCFPIFLMKSTLRTYDVIGFKNAGNTLLCRTQYAYDDIGLAKHIVENKILNQHEMLLRQRYGGDELREAVYNLEQYRNKANKASSLKELLGIEGSASRCYFSHEFNNCDWNGRQPRVKRDYINTVLDLGYTLLFNFIESILYYFGFDLYVGVYHREYYMRKSLVCDLVEPFGPIIDQAIRNAVARSQIIESDFEIRNGQYQLNWDVTKRYIMILLKPILGRKDDIFKYIKDYYRAFKNPINPDSFPIFEA